MALRLKSARRASANSSASAKYLAGIFAVTVGIGASANATYADDCGDGEGQNSSYACGVDAIASDSAANSAFGNEAHAFGVGGNTSVGAAARTLGNRNTAVGFNTTAFGVGTTAIGADSHADFDGSAAIGNNVSTTRANQIAIGLNTSTYTLAGLPSQASKDLQGTTRNVVTTDAAGNIATSTFDVATLEDLSTTVGQNSSDIADLQDDVAANTATITNHTTTLADHTATLANHTSTLNSHTTTLASHTAELADHETRITANTTAITGLDTRVTDNENDIASLDGRLGVLETGLSEVNGRIDQAFEGTAMALAMASAGLPGDKNYAMSLNWGTFEGENAFAGTAHARINENVILSGGIGYGAAQHTVGGRAGVTVAW